MNAEDGRQVPPVGARSYWLDQALAADPGVPCSPLTGATEADVCIVGGGFAGLWTAYELTERAPALSVVLLEAAVCGAGPPAPLPPEPLRWPLVRVAEWAYESHDRAAEQGRTRPALARAVIAAMERYAG